MNRRLDAARRAHQAWLRAVGVRRPARKNSAQWRAEYAESIRAAPPAEHRPTGGVDATADRSLMSRLHREPAHVRAEILRKAAMVAPAFNKGALQYVCDTRDTGE